MGPIEFNLPSRGLIVVHHVADPTCTHQGNSYRLVGFPPTCTVQLTTYNMNFIMYGRSKVLHSSIILKQQHTQASQCKLLDNSNGYLSCAREQQFIEMLLCAECRI